MSRGSADLWGGFEANRRFDASCRSACRVGRSFLFARVRVPQVPVSHLGPLTFLPSPCFTLISAPIRVAGHLRPVTSHQSLSFDALPFARGCRSARIRMESHDT